MSDDNNAQSFAAAGSGKSEAEVAFDLLNKLKGQGVWGERNIGAILDMYAECLDAAKGLRAYEGQKRVEAPVVTPKAAAPQAQAPQPAVQAQQAPVQQSQAQPAQTQQVPQQQPVHVQQQMVQQAYKPG